MSQLSSKAQLKENAALLEALRQKYAEKEDIIVAGATEALFKETSETLGKANSDARELIQSNFSLSWQAHIAEFLLYMRE